MKANKQATAANLIAQLNPVIRGWANYHRHVVSKATFYQVDNAIFKLCGSGPNEGIPRSQTMGGGQILRAPRWTTLGLRGDSVESEGVIRLDTLFAPETCRSNGTSKIKGEANPYDPGGNCTSRNAWREDGTRPGGPTAFAVLWKEQDGICPVCHQKITTADGMAQPSYPVAIPRRQRHG